MAPAQASIFICCVRRCFTKNDCCNATFASPPHGKLAHVTFFFTIGLPYFMLYKNVASAFHQPILPMPIWPNPQILFHHGISEHWYFISFYDF